MKTWGGGGGRLCGEQERGAACSDGYRGWQRCCQRCTAHWQVCACACAIAAPLQPPRCTAGALLRGCATPGSAKGEPQSRPLSGCYVLARRMACQARIHADRLPALHPVHAARAAAGRDAFKPAGSKRHCSSMPRGSRLGLHHSFCRVKTRCSDAAVTDAAATAKNCASAAWPSALLQRATHSASAAAVPADGRCCGRMSRCELQPKAPPQRAPSCTGCASRALTAAAASAAQLRAGAARSSPSMTARQQTSTSTSRRAVETGAPWRAHARTVGQPLSPHRSPGCCCPRSSSWRTRWSGGT